MLKNATGVTEVFQYDASQKEIGYIGEANRYNFKQFDGTLVLYRNSVKILKDTKNDIKNTQQQ